MDKRGSDGDCFVVQGVMDMTVCGSDRNQRA